MNKCVLIIEDDKLLAEVYQRSLNSENIEAVVAHNSTTALSLLKKRPINFIILDIVLGDCNGFEFLKKLRRQLGFNSISILIVTGLNTDEIGLNKELCVSLNIVGIYTKSQFAISKLVEVVKFGLDKNEPA